MRHEACPGWPRVAQGGPGLLRETATLVQAVRVSVVLVQVMFMRVTVVLVQVMFKVTLLKKRIGADFLDVYKTCAVKNTTTVTAVVMQVPPPPVTGPCPPTGTPLPSPLLTVLRSHRWEEHTSDLQSLIAISYDVVCLKTKKKKKKQQ